jgi:hypothetical protein
VAHGDRDVIDVLPGGPLAWFRPSPELGRWAGGRQQLAERRVQIREQRSKWQPSKTAAPATALRPPFAPTRRHPALRRRILRGVAVVVLDLLSSAVARFRLVEWSEKKKFATLLPSPYFFAKRFHSRGPFVMS